MEAIRIYILSLAGVSFISSLVCALLPEIPAKKTVKFICGIILAVTILLPLPGFEPEFSGIFTDYESYNLNSNEMNNLNRNIIVDKVSEIVEKVFMSYGIKDVMTEVVFDSEGSILAVRIDKYNEGAARQAASTLGLPYELIHMTE